MDGECTAVEELKDVKLELKELNAELGQERKESRRLRVLNSKLVGQVDQLRRQLEDANKKLDYAEEKLKEDAIYVESLNTESPLNLPYDACITVEEAEMVAHR